MKKIQLTHTQTGDGNAERHDFTFGFQFFHPRHLLRTFVRVGFFVQHDVIGIGDRDPKTELNDGKNAYPFVRFVAGRSVQKHVFGHVRVHIEYRLFVRVPAVETPLKSVQPIFERFIERVER